MSKLSKLVFHPIRFFADAKKKKNAKFFAKKVDIANLFVVSHVGQLAQIQSLIKNERLQKNGLIVLSTTANKVMPRLIMSSVEPGLFNTVANCVLPRSPNAISVSKLTDIRGKYEKILKEAQPERLFLLSFERHYCLLDALAKSMSIPVSLIEEGTATYKFNGDGSNLSAIGVAHSPQERWAAKVIQRLPWYANLRPALGRVEQFDTVYAAFPELLEGAFKFRRAERFFVHAAGLTVTERVKGVVRELGMNSSDWLFVSQRYPVRDDVYARSILAVLRQVLPYVAGRIFIKLHPKDRDTLKNHFRESAADPSLDGKVVLIEESDFLVEPALSVFRPAVVLGLTSTTLVYAPLVSPNTAVYSLAEWIINSIKQDEEYDAELDRVNDIQDHLAILRRFPHVQEALSTDGFAREISPVQAISVENDVVLEQYESEMSKAFDSGLYRKYLCLADWLYRGSYSNYNLTALQKTLHAVVSLKMYDDCHNVIEAMLVTIHAQRDSLTEEDFELALQSLRVYLKNMKKALSFNDQWSLVRRLQAIHKQSRLAHMSISLWELYFGGLILTEDWIAAKLELSNAVRAGQIDVTVQILVVYHFIRTGDASVIHQILASDYVISSDVKKHWTEVLTGEPNSIRTMLNSLETDTTAVASWLLVSAYWDRSNGDNDSAMRKLLQAERNGRAEFWCHAEVIQMGFARKKWAAVQKQLESIFGDVNHMPASFARSYLVSLIQSNNQTRALSVFTAGLESFSHDKVFVRSGLDLLVKSKRWADVARLCEDLNDVDLPIWTKITAYRYSGRLEEAYAMYNENQPPLDRSDMVLLAAELCALADDYGQAESLYRRIVTDSTSAGERYFDRWLKLRHLTLNAQGTTVSI